jgi:hypothetical protein
LAVGSWLLAVGRRKKKNFAFFTLDFFLLHSSVFLRPSSFSMIPVISTIPVVQLASGDRLSLQVYQFQGAVHETKGYI